MIVLPDAQGSEGWELARLGRITASNFDRLLTPTGKQAKGSAVTRLCAEKVAEWILGAPIDSPKAEAMEWGKAYEGEAVDAYSIETDADPEPVGLCLRDDLDVGASPDRLVGADGLLEVKCPWQPAVQVMYLMDPDLLVADYKPQVQGQLWVTGRSWADLYAWHPSIPSVRVRCVPDPDWIGMLEAVVRETVGRIEGMKADLRGRGVVPMLDQVRARFERAEKARKKAEPKREPSIAPLAPVTIPRAEPLSCETHADQSCGPECAGRLAF